MASVLVSFVAHETNCLVDGKFFKIAKRFFSSVAIEHALKDEFKALKVTTPRRFPPLFWVAEFTHMNISDTSVIQCFSKRRL